MSDEWKPIETAPKNGTRIITFSLGLVGTSRYVEHFAPVYGLTEAGWYSEQLDRRHEPTHWMALPSPPSPPSQEGRT